MKGSNDGSNWTTLDTQTNQNARFRQWLPELFPVTGNTTSYLYYRLDISANNGNAYLGVTALRLMGVDTPNNGAAGNKKPARLYMLDESGGMVMALNNLYR
jgi:hypothetical protein